MMLLVLFTYFNLKGSLFTKAVAVDIDNSQQESFCQSLGHGDNVFP